MHSATQMNANCTLGLVFLFFNYFVIKNLQKELFRLKLVQCMFLFTFYHLACLFWKGSHVLKGPDGGKCQTRGGSSERRPLEK